MGVPFVSVRKMNFGLYLALILPHIRRIEAMWNSQFGFGNGLQPTNHSGSFLILYKNTLIAQRSHNFAL